MPPMSLSTTPAIAVGRITAITMESSPPKLVPTITARGQCSAAIVSSTSPSDWSTP
jgi:hypothetical protein